MSDERPAEGPKGWLARLTQAFSPEPRNRDDLLELLHEAHDNQLIDSEALSIVEGAIQVADLQVRDVMLPRSKIISIKACQSPAEFLPAVIASAHSRYPVIGDDSDDVLGILLVKDLLALLLKERDEPFDIRPLLRPVKFVPESKRLNVLLREFRSNRNHMALVIDEYGSVSGLITIEDVLEQIVGEIEDEHDIEPESFVNAQPNGDFIVKAQTPVQRLNSELEASFDTSFKQIDQLLLETFGHLPRRNEEIELAGFRIKVITADSRQLHLLRLTPLNLAR